MSKVKPKAPEKEKEPTQIGDPYFDRTPKEIERAEKLEQPAPTVK